LDPPDAFWPKVVSNQLPLAKPAPMDCAVPELGVHRISQSDFLHWKDFRQRLHSVRVQTDARSGFDVAKSQLFVARTGIRGSNDLVWVGSAANTAAKMWALRQGDYASYITADVYQSMHESIKRGGQPSQPMWENYLWAEEGLNVYRSNWWWRVD
jgi:hypothetical protein